MLQGGSGCCRRDNCPLEQPLGPHLLHGFLGSVRLEDGGYGCGGGPAVALSTVSRERSTIDDSGEFQGRF